MAKTKEIPDLEHQSLQTIVSSAPDVHPPFPTKLPVLPLRDVVVFPYMIFPVLVGRPSSLNSAGAALMREKYIMLVAQKNSGVDEPAAEDLYTTGTLAKIAQVIRLPNGLMKILVDGLATADIKRFLPNKEFLEAEIVINEQSHDVTSEFDALVRHLDTLFESYVKSNRELPPETLIAYENTRDAKRKLYYVAANLQKDIDTKQKILQTKDLREQFFELLGILSTEIDVLKLEQEIDAKVQANIQKSQRKYFIAEQIRMLQTELGDEEETNPDIQKLREQIEAAGMTDVAKEKALDELSKLKKTPAMSPESTVIRNYIEWLVDVPWKKRTEDHLSVTRSRKILDEDHYGLEKPKERICEHIAVLNLVKEMRGQILCFVGPPGVGKTSLGKSIARALGRKFARISLGGMRDEAEIRGHRRTYIGSMPGKIIQSMKKTGVVNPVILLDEIDKMSMDFRGDPSAAMLEVLDPEQNTTFNDHYLDIDYDLSQVLFITTANVRHEIPLPLQDRMEIIELTGYLEHDKLEIAKRHIVPKQRKEHGLTESDVLLTDAAILGLVREYTSEAGVRNLEREIAKIFRKVAHEIVRLRQKNGKQKTKSATVSVTPAELLKYLGVPRHRKKAAEKIAQVGSVTGLAWTSVGGEILPVEVTIMEGTEKLTLTGQLGDVMKESAQAALSYIRSHVDALGVPKDFFTKKELHVHLPEGAIPKDGPSAGITMTMAMISAASGRPARADVAMTGEITLRGNVLPIGGLTEKLLAAKRSGITTVIIPKENEKDLTEIPAGAKKDLKIIPVETILEAMPIVFEGKKKKKKIVSLEKRHQ